MIIKGHSKKVYFDLNHRKKSVFLHCVQHVSNDIFDMFLEVVKFWPFVLYFMGIFGAKKFADVKKGSELSLPDRLGI